MQNSRKKEIRIKAASFRENCKVGRYGVLDLFKDCERCGFKLLRYPLGENADLGFTLKKNGGYYYIYEYVQPLIQREFYIGT